jgi:hypothetical protein
LGLFCSFKLDLQIIGLWIGNSSGVAFQAITFIYVTSKADWLAIANKATETMRNFRQIKDDNDELAFEANDAESQTPEKDS